MGRTEGTFLEKHGDMILKVIIAISGVVVSVVVSFIGYGWRLGSVEAQARDTKNELQSLRGEVQETGKNVSEIKGMFQEHVRVSSLRPSSAVQYGD